MASASRFAADKLVLLASLKPFAVLTSKLPDSRCRVLERHEEACLEGRDDFNKPRLGRDEDAMA